MYGTFGTHLYMYVVSTMIQSLGIHGLTVGFSAILEQFSNTFLLEYRSLETKVKKRTAWKTGNNADMHYTCVN